MLSDYAPRNDSIRFPTEISPIDYCAYFEYPAKNSSTDDRPAHPLETHRPGFGEVWSVRGLAPSETEKATGLLGAEFGAYSFDLVFHDLFDRVQQLGLDLFTEHRDNFLPVGKQAFGTLVKEAP